MTVRDVRPVQSSPPGGLSLEERVLQLEQILANVLTDAAGNLILSEATVRDRLLVGAGGKAIIGTPDKGRMELDGGNWNLVNAYVNKSDGSGIITGYLWFGWTGVNGGFLVLENPAESGATDNAAFYLDERGVTDIRGTHIIVPNRSSDPTDGVSGGSVYYNTTSSELRYYNGSTWVAL